MRRMGLGVLAAALAAGMTAPEVGGDVEVIPRPRGLGDWIERNERRRQTKGAFGAPPRPKGRKRLQRATGPGSYDAWKKALAVERAAKRLALNGEA